MSYATWDPPYRVTTISPSRIDLFVVTLIDGKPATVVPIMEYDEALAKARSFHRDHPKCQIKVLPLSGPECRNLLGIKPSDSPEPLNATDRQQMVDKLMQIARESSDLEASTRSVMMLHVRQFHHRGGKAG
ncbi:hypothetical protein [uncultured Sphingomonas sp.]|uniref:hypothetical protein n=1 Tax=uncultured Sphingomonas sp. TaxID=158754 RepID=UPI0025F2E6B0|nr:hypothetical protein [uncultured Sphingomonas sp.]